MFTNQADAEAPTLAARFLPNYTAEPAWTKLECFAFRFVVAYFTMFFCGTLLDTGAGPRKLLALLSEPPVRWLAQGVLHLPESSVGGPKWALAQQSVAFAIAGI